MSLPSQVVYDLKVKGRLEVGEFFSQLWTDRLSTRNIKSSEIIPILVHVNESICFFRMA